MTIKFQVVRAWFVHFYTASGLIAAFAAFRSILAGDARGVFLWLGAALVVDATDGPMARRWKVAEWLPMFSGRKLDDIVDYINYTFIPVLFAYHFQLVTGPAVFVLPLVLLASVYGFCQQEAKTEDGYFTGFPNYWNLVVFYLYLLGAPSGLSAAVMGLFALLVFIPIKYLTWKTTELQQLTLALSMIWGISLAGLLIWFQTLPQWAVGLTLLYPAYHLGASLTLALRSG